MDEKALEQRKRDVVERAKRLRNTSPHDSVATMCEMNDFFAKHRVKP